MLILICCNGQSRRVLVEQIPVYRYCRSARSSQNVFSRYPFTVSQQPTALFRTYAPTYLFSVIAFIIYFSHYNTIFFKCQVLYLIFLSPFLLKNATTIASGPACVPITLPITVLRRLEALSSHKDALSFIYF